MNRFEQLLEDIRGNGGKWIKATKHSAEYDRIKLNDTDKNGWAWWNEIEQKYLSSEILIFKIGRSNDNWFVLPKFENDFRKKHENARLK